MNPTAFIVGLMRLNTDALGFIPRPDLEKRFISCGRYVLQTTRSGRPIGYIIHGPVHTDGVLHIHQAVVELDKRNRGFGLLAVRELIDRARRHGATRILLRCAADLEATAFWGACGFLPTGAAFGGRRRNRTIIHFALELDGTPGPRASPFLSPLQAARPPTKKMSKKSAALAAAGTGDAEAASSGP